MIAIDTYLGKTKLWRSPETETPVDYCDLDNGKEFEVLRRACAEREAEVKRSSFGLKFNNCLYRVSAMDTSYDYIYVIRKVPDVIPELKSLNIPIAYLAKLMVRDIRGLVLVTGATGSGKTTTVSSLLVQRLKDYGGLGVSCEDPPEMPLEGPHGKGLFFQTDVDKFGSFANAMREAVRWTPNVIFLGEIRDADTAFEALRASVNGHLVFATVHATDPIKALLRIKSLAPDSQSGELNALMAEGLTAVLHQNLKRTADKFEMETEFLSLIPDNTGLRNLIRTGKYEQLTSNIIDNRNQALHMSAVV